MNALDLLIAKSPPARSPLYALYGDDDYLKNEVLRAVVRAAIGEDDEELAVTKFPGDKAALADVLDEVRTLPFLSRSRVVVVTAADPFVTAHRRELEEYAEAPSSNGVLILEVKTWPGSTKLAKVVQKNGQAIECKSPAEREFAPWLVKFAKARHGVALAGDASALLLDLVGAETGLLVSELEKLATAVAAKGRIDADDVAKNVGAGRVEKIWTILEAATAGRAEAALENLDRLIDSGEHPVGLLAAMTANLRKLHHAGELRRARLDLTEACKQAGIPAYPGAIDKTAKQHGHLGPGRVSQLPRTLLKADLDLKGFSTLPPRVVLERLLVELARPRAD